MNRLVLLSPVGTTEKTDEEIEKQLKERTGEILKGNFSCSLLKKFLIWELDLLQQ